MVKKLVVKKKKKKRIPLKDRWKLDSNYKRNFVIDRNGNAVWDYEKK